jgi:hypothetical protein
MHSKQFGLMLGVLIALASILWAVLPNHPPEIGIVLALPLVFLLPGYALTALLYRHALDNMH